MELGKKTVSGEELEYLKSISPKIAKLAGTATSLELKADQVFSDTKKGKTAKEKFYIFIGILLFDRQPIIMKKNFTWKVRTNITSKAEVDSILEEAGVKDTKGILERAKKHYEEKEKEKTAPKTATSKGKPEHASESTRLPRGMRARFSKMREGNEPYFNEYNDSYRAEFEREMTREERERTAKVMEKLRKNQAERDRWHREFLKKEAAAWQRQFPGKPYTTHETYGWIYNESLDKWEKVADFEPPRNPFYNDEFWRNHFSGKERAEPPQAPAPPPPEPIRQVLSCKELLKQKGILIEGDDPKENKKRFLRWALINHPDKQQGLSPEELRKITEEFQQISGCYDTEIKSKLPHGGAVNITRKRRKH